MYRVDERGNVFYLVALQWADKMPFDVLRFAVEVDSERAVRELMSVFWE